MKKITIIFTILAILIVMISCRNAPEQEHVVYFEPEKEEVVWTQIEKVSYAYSFSSALGSGFDLKVKESSFTYRLRSFGYNEVSNDSAVGKDFNLLDLDRDGKIKKYECLLEYTQPDEGLGERNWHIAFFLLADEYPYSGSDDPEKREKVLARRPAPNQMRAFIYDAHGVDKNGNTISDEELGWNSDLLNGWLAVEFSDFKCRIEYPDPIEDEENHIRTCYRYENYSQPKYFSFTATDISGMTEESPRLSALPAFDTRIIGLKFERY